MEAIEGGFSVDAQNPFLSRYGVGHFDAARGGPVREEQIKVILLGGTICAHCRSTNSYADEGCSAAGGQQSSGPISCFHSQVNVPVSSDRGAALPRQLRPVIFRCERIA